MQKNILKTIVLVLLIFNNCKKGDDILSKTKLLTQKKWFVIASKYSLNGGAWVDDYNTMPNCVNDDFVSFNADGSYIKDEGATKCLASLPQIIGTGTWSFTTNDTKISTSEYTNGAADILQLDANTLKISGQFTSGSDFYKFETTYGH
jgi:hypothetical protein